jgi:hypothetical protein
MSSQKPSSPITIGHVGDNPSTCENKGCWIVWADPGLDYYFAPTKPYNTSPFDIKLHSSLKSHLRWLLGTCGLKCSHSPGLGTSTRASSTHMTHSPTGDRNPSSHNHNLCQTLKAYFALLILTVALRPS